MLSNSKPNLFQFDVFRFESDEVNYPLKQTTKMRYSYRSRGIFD